MCIFSRHEKAFKIGNEEIKNVKTFEYLGIEFNLLGIDYNKQITKNINKARRKWFKAENSGFLNKLNISINNQIQFLKSIIFPPLEYGILFRMVKKTYIKRIQNIVCFYIKKILGLTKARSVSSICWITGIEKRKEKYMRALKNLVTQIEEDNGYARSNMIDQDKYGDRKKNILIKLLKEASTWTSRNKKENLASYMENLTRRKYLLQKMIRLKDGKFSMKFLTGDLYKIENEVFTLLPFGRIYSKRLKKKR
jgi:hypothetical protein